MSLVIKLEPTPIRKANNALAEAHRQALLAGDDRLVRRIKTLWAVAECRCSEEEERAAHLNAVA